MPLLAYGFDTGDQDMVAQGLLRSAQAHFEKASQHFREPLTVNFDDSGTADDLHVSLQNSLAPFLVSAV